MRSSLYSVFCCFLFSLGLFGTSLLDFVVLTFNEAVTEFVSS